MMNGTSNLRVVDAGVSSSVACEPDDDCVFCGGEAGGVDQGVLVSFRLYCLVYESTVLVTALASDLLG